MALNTYRWAILGSRLRNVFFCVCEGGGVREFKRDL